MVKHSLRNMIEKYPYFFDKRPISNFFKITKVYNKNFQLMYNDLFKTYQSFHLNKRMYIWKEQTVPYDYNINFVANFPLLKSVKIYKNNILIYKEQYLEKDEVEEFAYTYSTKYSVGNTLELEAYQCTSCNRIYFSDNLSSTCECGNNEFIPVKAYKCEECGEIYFNSSELNDCSINNHENSLKEVNIYKCKNCGQVYFGENPPDECGYCYEDEENTIPTQMGESSSSVIHLNDNYTIEDNSVDYNEYGDTILMVNVTDSSTDRNPVKKAIINLKCGNNVYKGVANGNGVAIIPNLINGTYEVNVALNGYEENNSTITLNENTTLNITLNKYEEFPVEEETYDAILSPISDDKFIMVVETYEEYELIKGFPENDYVQEDAFDHDYSLDEMGALNNIPRKKYRLVEDDSQYPYTEPPYNNKETEDDYHYMKRMIEYNLRLWYMSPPCLELWKMYGIESEIINRERYLLKVFDEQKHPFDESTGLVKCWTPEAWEHKDKFCDGSAVYGEYFFVNSSTVRPIRGENVDFNFQVLNSLSEPVEEEYYVNIYKLLEDGSRVQISKKPISDKRFRLSYKSIELEKPTVVLFEAFYSNDLPLGTCKVVLNTRSSADWYVDSNHIEYPPLTTSYFIKTDNWSVTPDKEGNALEFTETSEILFDLADNSVLSFNIEGDDLFEQIYFKLGNNSYRNFSLPGIEPQPQSVSDFRIEVTNGLYKIISDSGNILINLNEGEEIIGIKIIPDEDNTVILSNCYYIDRNYENYVGDGSIDRPFLTLEEALEKVNNSMNYICLMSDVELNNPVVISQNTIITGMDKYSDENDSTTRYVPKIFQKGTVKYDNKIQYRRDFFKIVGNKDCKLILSNLRLVSGQISTFIGINYWVNTNNSLDSFESVIIHGGTINVLIEPNQETYYPFDFIEYAITLQKKDGTPLPNNDVEIYYKNTLLATLTTNADGECTWNYNINEQDLGEYVLQVINKSDVFFEASTPSTVQVAKSPHYYYPKISEGNDVEVTIANYEVGDEFDLYSEDGELFESIEIEDANDLNYTFENLDVGRYVFYSTIDDENDSSVLEEWIIEFTGSIESLANQEFMKNLSFNEVTGQITYDTVTLGNQPKLGDLDNIVIGIKMSEDNEDLIISNFNVPREKLEDTEITYTDLILLQGAIIDLQFNMETGMLEGVPLGTFWE